MSLAVRQGAVQNRAVPFLISRRRTLSSTTKITHSPVKTSSSVPNSSTPLNPIITNNNDDIINDAKNNKKAIISCSRIFSSMAVSPPGGGGGINNGPTTTQLSRGLSNFFQPLQQQQHQSPPPPPPLNGTNGHTTNTPLTFPTLIRPHPTISMEAVRELARQRPTPLSLSMMYQYASSVNAEQRLRNAQFLHRELPIRIAQRVVDLMTLPHGLSKTRQVRNVTERYLSYLDDLSTTPTPTTTTSEKNFTQLLSSFVLDRTSIPMAIACSISSLKDHRRESLDDRRLREIEEALYRFFTARVGLRFLTEHFILGAGEAPAGEYLRRKQACVVGDARFFEMPHEEKKELGCIRKDVDAVREVRMVAEQVGRDCLESFGAVPRIEIVEGKKKKGVDFTYVPHHLRYMMAEVLKNSCRSTIKKCIADGIDIHSDEANIPRILVVIVKGKEDVTIKVADRGGGVPRSEMEKIWTFAHSTLDKDKSSELKETTEFATNEFTGNTIRGFGLPLARIYARYFGGELTLKSTEGYGLDAYLHLPVLGVACEKLPDKVERSPGNRDSNPDRLKVFHEYNRAFPAALNPDLLERLSQRAL